MAIHQDGVVDPDELTTPIAGLSFSHGKQPRELSRQTLRLSGLLSFATVLVVCVADILRDALSIGGQSKPDKVNGLLFRPSLAIIFGDFEKPQVEAIKSSPQNTGFLKSLTLRSRSSFTVIPH